MQKTSKKRGRKRKPAKNYVVVTTPSYGIGLRGSKIYFEGPRPRSLKTDGRIKLGKHVLQALTKRYPRFRWIITRDVNSIVTERGIVRVRTAQALLNRMDGEYWDRSRDIKADIVRRFMSSAFPDAFTETAGPVYVPGTLVPILSPAIVPRLSPEDRDALTAFLPAFVSSESVGTVNLLKATAQIETLKELADDLERSIGRSHGESWWQDYIKKNILLMQQGYIKALGKMNVAVGNTKFPDFSLITHDNYLDILEIKPPSTPILRRDSSRGNYFWDTEIAKAIIQVENYIANVSAHADSIRSYLLDEHKLSTKAVRPRGIILVGDTRQFAEQKQRDDFRLLSQGIKNVSILTYDELLTRLKNYIKVLEQFRQEGLPEDPPRRKRRQRARRM